ncbi:MAG TPA: DNA repair protein RadC [Myxococcales bacterium]|nr:DNA repair protein RadC [Myxococcales bacterium]
MLGGVEEDAFEEEAREAGPQGPAGRLLHLGPAALSDSELLSLVLAAGAGGAASLQLGQWLLDTSGGLRALALRDPGELADERGLRAGQAALLCAAVELGRRVHRGTDPRPLLSTARDIIRYVAPMASSPRECFRVLALNARQRLIRDTLVAQGCVDRVMVDPRDALAPSVVARASFVVLVHNHPSGDPRPSDQDLAITRRLVNAAAVLGFRVLDHLIVGAEGYLSLREAGLLPEPEPMPGEVACGPPRRQARLTPDPESS